ncbi:MAG: tRNA (adenosine(37)-N6)-threonylcarbamoyltransferase complex ATPase subunit type 1 TsaE [Eubacterium sp.]|nr:tRNA (adenosine(37)-N6)-threonylcarbamoyltransferase complex ATPase subunit type 1 TsaE [Eubacterium sp.]
MVYETYSAEETAQLGEKLAQQFKPGSICALNGELGVGKTVFAQGVAQGLGITEPICSPTFTIVQVYEEGRMPFYHFDVYRIADLEEMEEIGYEEYFYGDGFTLVEWAERIEGMMPSRYERISIEKDLEKGFDYRRIVVESVGDENGGAL